MHNIIPFNEIVLNIHGMCGNEWGNQHAMGECLIQAHAEAHHNYKNYRNSSGKSCSTPKQAMKVFFDDYCKPLGIDGATLRRYGQVAEKLTIEEVHLIGGMTNATVISMDKLSDEERQEYIQQAREGKKWTVKELRESVKLRLEPSYEEMKAKAKADKEEKEAQQAERKEKYGEAHKAQQDAIQLCDGDLDDLVKLEAMIQQEIERIQLGRAADAEFDMEEEQAALLGDFAHYEHEDTTCAHPFDTLELSADASWAEARKAYKKLASKYHPDKHVDKSERAQKVAAGKFRKVQHAMDLLEAYYKGK